MEERNELVVIENPQGNLEKAQAICRFIQERRDEVLAQIEAADNAIDETNYRSAEAKAEVERLEGIVESLRDAGKRLVGEVCRVTEAQRVLTAIDSRLWSFKAKADPESAYAKISAAFKALKDRVKGYAEADKPKMPVRAVAVVLYATDKGVADLAAKIKAGKVAGVEGYQFAPDEDAERKAVALIEGSGAAQ